MRLKDEKTRFELWEHEIGTEVMEVAISHKVLFSYFGEVRKSQESLMTVVGERLKLFGVIK